MKILARHKYWIAGCTITESDDEAKSETGQTGYRRFTATIRGWENWRLFEGHLKAETGELVRARARAIRDRIYAGDKSVFAEPQPYLADQIRTTGSRETVGKL